MQHVSNTFRDLHSDSAGSWSLISPVKAVIESSRRHSSPISRAPRRRSTLAKVFSGLSIKKHSDETPEEIRGPLGLRLLFDAAEPLADVIFVHGLGGGSRKTWDKNDDPQLYWPREWLSRDPEFKHVRLHTFGYHADWIDRRESNLHIYDFATDLLAQLQASPAIRRGKHAFISSQHDPSYQSLGKRFDTIYFLATPHHGAHSAQFLNTLLKATQAGNKPFVTDLKYDSPAIQAINDEFRHYCNQVNLFSFYEEKPTSVSGFGDVYIVTKGSAMMNLPLERVSSVTANHRGVCKYDSPSDPNYILVRNSIVEALDRITETWTIANDTAIKAQKRKLRSFLHISDELRQFHVDFDEPRVDGSCEWLGGVPSFRQWRDASEPRIFWLCSNPGTGKSFLAKYVADHVSDLGFDCSYFFFRAGDKVRSSLKGCLLSLAWQMAENNVFIRDSFLEMYDSENDFDQENFQSIWRTLFVGGVFNTKLMKPHFWVLDGLDECTNHGELFPLLAKISSSFRLQIFISSRPSFEMQGSIQSNSLHVTTYNVTQQETATDIKRYVESHIDFPSLQRQSDREEIVAAILRKSEASFLWVRLVLKELRGAVTKEATWKVLDAVPQGMNQLYRRSLNTLADKEMQARWARAILMWASTCVRPLDVTELSKALYIHIQETFHGLESHIGLLCGYLVTVDSNGLVKMVHETARSFALDPHNGSPVAFDVAEAHENLAVVCLKYLNDKELRAPRGRRSAAGQPLAVDRSAFLKYAAVAWHEHMERSQSTSEEIVDLLHNFCKNSAGNILTWVEYVATMHNDLTIITRAGVLMRSFATRVAKDHILRQTEKLDRIKDWSKDLIRIVAKFGRNLLRLPASIYTTIPPFCPRQSAIYQQFGHSQRGLGVSGVFSLLDWDDCLATIVYKQKGHRSMSVAATSSFFAVGMSSPFVRLYHTTICQEFAMVHHGEAVRVIEIGLTGQWMATAGNKRLCVWDVATRKLVWEYSIPRPCMAMTFNLDNDELIVACQDNRLRYFHVESGELNVQLSWYMDEDHAQKIATVPVAAAMSFQHQLLAFVYRGGHIGLWNWDTDEFLGFCEKPGARLKALSFHASSLVFSPVPNSNSLAAAYEQGEILVFDPVECIIKASYKGKTDDQVLACSPDGRTLIAGDSVGVIRIFDFQNLDTPERKLRLLDIISGVEENIRSLVFCDDRRFVDIRGPKVKVWEPTILVRQEFISDTDSITSESLTTTDPVAEEPDPITSLTVHPSGKHVFCATQKGLIHIYEVSTGQCSQTIYVHAGGDTITWMIFSKAEDILASAGVSSKVIIHRLVLRNGQWVIVEKLFEYRMGERIEQLMFNPAGTKILVVTTTCDMVYSLVDEQTAKASWETRLPGVWCNDPRDPERLLLWVDQKLRVYAWDGLRELTPPAGISLDFDLPPGMGISTVHVGWKANYVATVYTEVDRARSNMRLLTWDASDFPSIDDGNAPAAAAGDDDEVSPCGMFQPYGSKVAELVGTLGTVIGFLDNRVVFLDQDGWVCSVFLEDAPPESYHRHFFLPFDWLSTDDALLVALTARNEILFAKDDELAVIKRGLDTSQVVPLPARSRRSSAGT